MRTSGPEVSEKSALTSGPTCESQNTQDNFNQLDRLPSHFLTADSACTRLRLAMREKTVVKRTPKAKNPSCVTS